MSYLLVSKWYLNVFQFCLLPGVLAGNSAGHDIHCISSNSNFFRGRLYVCSNLTEIHCGAFPKFYSFRKHKAKQVLKAFCCGFLCLKQQLEKDLAHVLAVLMKEL